MPKSRMRKKEKPFVPEAVAHAASLPEESPKWLAPLMVAGFIVGLLWIVVFYISSTKYPIPHIGAWNMVVGFGFVAFGFSLATRWR